MYRFTWNDETQQVSVSTLNLYCLVSYLVSGDTPRIVYAPNWLTNT